MESLREASADLYGVQRILQGRHYTNGLQPLMCYADLSCLYADSNSPTGLTSCDETGACAVVAACADGMAYMQDRMACAPVDSECADPVAHQLQLVTPAGVCAPAPKCTREWRWDGKACTFGRSGEKCDEGEDGRVWRYDNESACVETRDCSNGRVFSEMPGKCVDIGAECKGPDAQDRRLRAFDHTGACVPTNKCVSGWDFDSAGACLFAARGKACEPAAALRAANDRRVFEYDAMGACLATNRCAEGWALKDQACAFARTGAEVGRANHRVIRLDSRGEPIPAECEPGWTLSGQQCTYDRAGQNCDVRSHVVHKWDSGGTCVATAVCDSPDLVLLGSQCVPRQQQCPDGFARSGSECTRSFGMGGEGQREISFSADPSQQVRVQYTFRKDPRWRDGDYSVSTNFGFSAGRGGVGGSETVASGWVSGRKDYRVSARQNDGSGELVAWVKNA